jgi:hypothetical protein
MAKKKTEKTLDAADQFLQAQGASLRDISQNELEMLIDRAVKGEDKAAAKELQELIAKDVIHIPQGGSRPVLGPAPKPKAEAIPQDFGKSGKKKLTDEQMREMEAAEKRAAAAAAAQKKAEQEELNKLLAERKAAEEAKKTAPAEPEEPAKPEPKKEPEKVARKKARGEVTNVPTSRVGQTTPGARPVRTREVGLERPASSSPPAKKPEGVDVERPSRQEQKAAMERMRKGAQQIEAVEGTRQPASLSQIRKDLAEGKTGFAIKGLQGQNFKKAFSRLKDGAKVSLLQESFGPNVIRLNTVQRAKLGEVALAHKVMRDLGLEETPDFDNLDGRIKKLSERIQGAQVEQLVKGSLNKDIEAVHGQTLTSTGRIRAGNLKVASEERGQRREEFARKQREAEAAAKKEAAKMSRVPASPKETAGKKPAKPVSSGALPSFSSGEAAASPATPAPAPATKMPAERAAKLRQVLAEKGLTEQGLLTAINKKSNKGGYKTIEELPEALDKRIAEWVKKAEGAKPVPALSSSAPASTAAAAAAPTPAPAATATKATGPMAGPWSEAAPGGRVMGPTAATGELGPLVPSSLAAGKAAAPVPAATGKKPSATEVRDRAKKIFGNKGVGAMGGAMRYLGPLFGAFAAYQLLDMAREGTVSAAEERRLQALQALSGVSGGLMSDAQQRQQIRQMQQMVDLAAIQRQQGLDQMRQQYTTDQTLNSLLAGNERALAALAMPSRPSVAEMMARY